MTLNKRDVKMRMTTHVDFTRKDHLSIYTDEENGISMSIRSEKGVITRAYFTSRLPDQTFTSPDELIEAHNSTQPVTTK